MSPLLSNVYMVGEVNARVRGKGLKMLSVNGGRFEINQRYLRMMQHYWLIQRRSCVNW